MSNPLLEKKISRYSKLFKEVKNWQQYLLFKTSIFREDDFTFKFRNGFNLNVSRKMLGPFRECFFDDVYLKHFDHADFPPQPLILDIGANVGFSALYFFYQFPGAAIHSFEPMPFCQKVIEKYNQQFPSFNWSLHKYGLWKTTGSLEFFTDSTDDFSTVSGVNASGERQKRITVQVKAIAEIFEENNFRNIDLLKLDCEGAEYSILYNMPDAMLNAIKRLAIETHHSEESNKPELEAFLISKGFNINESLTGTDYIVACR
ncbi:MAG: FkbM family methyltransferase [Bacteroidota bacterium]